MKLAILFFYYKDVDVCKNRLEILRKFNPEIKVYGLFGGPIEEESVFRQELGSFMNDFYAFSEAKDAYWKWINGDLVINEWFRQRGKDLEWDTIIVYQWDMLMFGPVDKIFSVLKRDEILLSGIRRVKEVEEWWAWTKPGEKENHERYIQYAEHLKENHGYDNDVLCCQFVVVCLPRVFLAKYAYLSNPELGFVEYRIPTYASIFGIPFCTSHNFQCWWGMDPGIGDVPARKKVLNAQKWSPVPTRTILWHLIRKNGARVFHPYNMVFPFNAKDVLILFKDEKFLKEINPLKLWRFLKHKIRDRMSSL